MPERFRFLTVPERHHLVQASSTDVSWSLRHLVVVERHPGARGLGLYCLKVKYSVVPDPAEEGLLEIWNNANADLDMVQKGGGGGGGLC